VFNFYYQIFVPVNNFPINQKIYIEKGENAESILNKLEENKFIKSAFYGKILSKFIPVNFKEGEYFFDYSPSLYQVLTGVKIRQEIYKVTIPEGYTKFQIAEKIENLNLKNFNKNEFLQNAKEGYLFPDTYFFNSTDNVSNILEKFNKNFENKISKNFPDWKNLNEKQKSEIIIIASILEREARQLESMKMVAGILENRLRINMPLQVDATVLYGKGIWKERVYFKDLNSKTENEKNYNTYDRVGLPMGPISNPGINAIEAAIYPTKNNFIYYLTGADGSMYYAKTFSEHVSNRKYLR
jgi:UPF0755 protein